MKILITGAGGNLGRALVPALLAQGHTPRLMDFRQIETLQEFVQGDVRNAEDVRRAMAGVDVVVHAAALHGIHLSKWTPQDFWEINATGTFQVYEAARQAGVTRVVLCSTMGVYGSSAHPPEDAWNVVTEDLPCLPTDVYGLTKETCETMGNCYARRWRITTVALRLGMFVPEPNLERYGFRLLFGGVDDRDVTQAVLQALTYSPPEGFDFFNIMADVPFQPADTRALQHDPVTVVAHYYPGYQAICAARGIDPKPLLWGRTIWSIEKAKRLLNYQPHYNFEGFVNALEAGDTAYYPTAGLPWWGT